MNMMFGLKDKIIDKINLVFFQYENIERVILYGSRAMGNYKRGSDIDLSIISETGQLNFSEIAKIENQLDDLMLPYKIDLSLMKQISDPALIDHIHRAGIIFYQKPNTNKQAKD
jgi:predicted nucleotidyltransferase